MTDTIIIINNTTTTFSTKFTASAAPSFPSGCNSTLCLSHLPSNEYIFVEKKKIVHEITAYGVIR